MFRAGRAMPHRGDCGVSIAGRFGSAATASRGHPATWTVQSAVLPLTPALSPLPRGEGVFFEIGTSKLLKRPWSAASFPGHISPAGNPGGDFSNDMRSGFWKALPGWRL